MPRGRFSWGLLVALIVPLPAQADLITLANFSGGGNGANPEGDLYIDGQGNLFGTSTSGNGRIFELANGSNAITNLATFGSGGGKFPSGGFAVDASGNFFGTTGGGGANGDGAVYELPANSGTIKTLASFSGSGLLEQGVILDSQGNLYGTTGAGGAHGKGSIFEVAEGSKTITTLASFGGASGDLTDPDVNNLVRDANGNLFGIANAGGNSDRGGIFELAAGSSTITTLVKFSGNSGYNASSGLIMDGQGNLYGTTQLGGANGEGTVFELQAGRSTVTVLASFNDPSSSLFYSDLVRDSRGDLFGTTESGGAYGDGSVFEVVAGSGVVTTLFSFDGSDGNEPLGGLVVDANGNLFGTTDEGGSAGDGTVFEIRMQMQSAAAPEPSTLMLGALGVVAGCGWGLLRRFRP